MAVYVKFHMYHILIKIKKKVRKPEGKRTHTDLGTNKNNVKVILKKMV